MEVDLTVSGSSLEVGGLRAETDARLLGEFREAGDGSGEGADGELLGGHAGDDGAGGEAGNAGAEDGAEGDEHRHLCWVFGDTEEVRDERDALGIDRGAVNSPGTDDVM